MIDAVPPGDLPELAMLAFKLELHHVQVCRAGRAAGAPTVGDVARGGCWRPQEEVTPLLSELVDKDTVSTLIQYNLPTPRATWPSETSEILGAVLPCAACCDVPS